MNILVVDDEARQVKSICRGLRSRKHTAVEAFSGRNALDQIENRGGRIDVVVTDYAMPGMNGLDLLKTIRKVYGNLPLIMISAYADKKLLIDALKNRCDGFIEKPFTLDQLLLEIDRIARRGGRTGI